MTRKRKKERHNRTGNKKDKNRTFLDKPFKDLREDLEAFDKRNGPVSTPLQPERKKEKNDEDLFESAMKNVIPIKKDKTIITPNFAEEESFSKQSPKPHKTAEEDFSTLVKEPGAWDISFSDEYMVGAVSGVGPKIMKRLKRGEFSVQDYIDLHGLTKKEAETVVDEFIIKSYHKGMRCVLIVHGRGLGSLNHRPAIKKELPVWFRRGNLKKIVLAFVTARPCDGGAGALYVLLKKK